MGFLRLLVSTGLLLFTVHCYVGSNGSEPPNQGAIQQNAAGQIIVNLSSRGISGDARLTETSMVALYLYKKKDYSLSCVSAADKKKCEDALILKNEKIDSLAFTNEPGYYGYDADFNSYSPTLIADQGYNFPSTKPADPPGFPDADVWQCFRNSYPSNPNYGKFECGVNAHPIRYFNKALTTYTMQVYATNGKGFASSYILDYNLFNSMNHPVKDGDRYYAYFAVHFNALRAAADSENRFDFNASTWKRPVEPDLISPRIEINVKLLAEGHYDKPGSSYDIPDYSTWYDPFGGCRVSAGVAGSVYFSEVLWMGSKDTAGVGASEDKFVELYNNTAADINISGWKLNGVGTGAAAITLPICTVIKANSFYAVGFQTSKAFTKLDYVTAISLTNTGEALSISDALGNAISNIAGCSAAAWNGKGVNGGANTPKRSMRLVSVTAPDSTCGAGWTTTSTFASNYNASSANVAAAYKASADTSTEGTVATPGFTAP